jgi:oxygen-independent coproporphyrinogen-3 oxidase
MVSKSAPLCDSDSLRKPEPSEGNYFVAAYPPFSVWTADDVHAYRAILQDEAIETPLVMYLHLPFCSRRCDFCYYLSYAGKRPEDMESYLDVLLAELRYLADQPVIQGRTLRSVYVGGGTPSLLSSRQITKLFDAIRSAFPMDDDAEITVECAPGSSSMDTLQALKESGVTRVSMGVQSTCDAVLQASRRMHMFEDVRQAYERMRTVGFAQVNLDLIVGLPGQTDDTFRTSVDDLVRMETDSLTLYQLEVPHNTPLFKKNQRSGAEKTYTDWAVKRKRLMDAYDQLEACGYNRISAYTAVRGSHQFTYQSLQYHGADLLGAGASSFSYVQGVHAQNVASLKGWQQQVEAGCLPVDRAYALSTEEQMIRQFVLQLKLGRVRAEHFLRYFQQNPMSLFQQSLRLLAIRGMLEFDEDGLIMTHKGLAHVDRIIPEFYLKKHCLVDNP